MTSECIMCGRPATNGILCERCDRPRRGEHRPPAGNVAPKPSADPFPAAPVVKFPVETTSVALTDIREILEVSRLPSMLMSSDRKVRYMSDEARSLLGLDLTADTPLEKVETILGFKIPQPKETQTSTIEIGGQAIIFSVIPLSGSASGFAVIFRAKVSNVPDEYMAFVRETILTPLVGLREALLAASAKSRNEPLLRDSASTIDQVLSSLELAPEIEEAEVQDSGRPSVASVARNLAERFGPLTRLKKIQLQFDFPDERIFFSDCNGLEDVLGILIENSLHYVLENGQIVVGLRPMEHKGHPLLLFFVMDNGPIVPQEMRETVFSPDFVWRPSAPQRTGRGLSRCRDFATTHKGSIWVESKTGKACTFFLRVRIS